MTTPVRVLAVVALAFVASSCNVPVKKNNWSTTFDPVVIQPTNPANVKVKLSTSAQKVYVVEGSKILLASPCSVGTASSPTPKGNFTIYSKQANRRRVSSPGAGYPMAYWMEFKTAYGMHWGFVKPYPCTHGCVRLPVKAAPKIFNLVRTGTPLSIATSQPEDESPEAKALPVLDDTTMPDPPNSYMMSSQFFADAAKGKLYTY